MKIPFAITLDVGSVERTTPAPGASNARSMWIASRHVTTRAPPGRTFRAGSMTRNRGTTKPHGTSSWMESLSRHHGSSLLSSVRDRVQSRPGRRGGGDQRR